MNVCIPVIEDRGLDSRVHAHFGSAPLFLLVDTARGSVRAIPGRGYGRRRGHGGGYPLAALAGEGIDCVVTGEIGRHAVADLRRAQVPVFLTTCGTVGDAVAAVVAGRLPEATPDTCHGRHARRRWRHGRCG